MLLPLLLFEGSDCLGDDNTAVGADCDGARKSRVTNRAGCCCCSPVVAEVVADADVVERSPQAHAFEELEEELRWRV